MRPSFLRMFQDVRVLRLVPDRGYSVICHEALNFILDSTSFEFLEQIFLCYETAIDVLSFYQTMLCAALSRQPGFPRLTGIHVAIRDMPDAVRAVGVIKEWHVRESALDAWTACGGRKTLI